ncbi:MAG: hypothetical protein CL920_35280 [Deltaproteobacteria bacterium]|nr:hypothetical protein [Deltaproteobacteria bacterium]MBU53987.1 hypothetical protein [Deltaproteobacteria bacterium]|tara:strand:- start:2897 stop:3637 length:741 start_codon:yes stop_codon:yes gene_type:complete
MRLFLLFLMVLFAFGPTKDAVAKDGWERTSNKGGLAVYRKRIKGSPLFAFRGEYTAPIHIGKLITLFGSLSKLKVWIENYNASGRLERPNEFERVYWLRFNMPWPIASRDFVLHVKASPEPKTRTVTALIKSVKHKKRPKVKGCVRAIIRYTKWKFFALRQKKGEGPKTKITVEVHMNPKGWIPAWIINSTQANWPRKTLTRLVKASHAFKPYPLLVNWHSPKPLFYSKTKLKFFAKLRKRMREGF